MKKLIVSIMIGIFCLTSGIGLAAATVLAGPPPVPAHHHSFWVHTGKWIAGAGLLWFLIEETKYHQAHPEPTPAPQSEMLPGDRALRNVYGDNIPARK